MCLSAVIALIWVITLNPRIGHFVKLGLSGLPSPATFNRAQILINLNFVKCIHVFSVLALVSLLAGMSPKGRETFLRNNYLCQNTAYIHACGTIPVPQMTFPLTTFPQNLQNDFSPNNISLNDP
jgi:hypothetical protein